MIGATHGMFERSAKLIVLTSIAAGLVLQVSLAARSWPEIPLLAAAAGVLAWAGGRTRPSLTLPPVLAALFVYPAMLIAVRGGFWNSDWILWLVAVFGLLLSNPRLLRWSVPRMWLLPLAYWALIVALSWPIVVLRETDFNPQFLFAFNGYTGFTANPLNAARAVLLVSSGTMIGILWFDYLFGLLQDGELRFERDVLLPLTAGWLIAGVVGAYQLLGDMSFLNPWFWATLRRAPGTFSDANVFAVVSALWGPALAMLALHRKWPAKWWIAAFALALSWVDIWAAGSRSSLLLAAIALFGVIAVARESGEVTTHRVVMLVVGAAVCFAAAVITSGRSAVGPIARLVADFGPRLSLDWASQMMHDLWWRGPYGYVAKAMIEDAPLTGIGIGAFHSLSTAYSWLLFQVAYPQDNAQNWYRHQLAELGVLGSLGWIVWTVTFLWTLISHTRMRDSITVGTGLLIVALAVICLVGVPTQDVVGMFAFWTLTFWWCRTVWREAPSNSSSANRLWLVIILCIGVVVHTAATASAAWNELRPPIRAMKGNWDYMYGFYEPDDVTDGARWTGPRAVAVIAAPKRWMELNVRVNHPEMDTKPVDVKVWRDGDLVINKRVMTAYHDQLYLRVPHANRIVLETWTNRLVRPRDLGLPDDRELGLLVKWSFVDAPPRNAVAIR